MDENKIDLQQQEAAAPKKKGSIALSIVGFVLGILTFIDSLSLLMYPLVLNIEKMFLKGKYEGGSTYLIIDTTLSDAIMRVFGIFSIMTALVGISLSIVGIILTAVKKGSKKGIVFGVIGLSLSVIGLCVAVAWLVVPGLFNLAF